MLYILGFAYVNGSHRKQTGNKKSTIRKTIRFVFFPLTDLS